MTIEEFHIKYHNDLDRNATNSYPYLDPEQVDLILNDTIRIFVKLRYGLNNIYGNAFEGIQKRTDDLRTLVKTSTVNISTVAYESDVFRATLPDDYFFYLRGRATTNTENCTGENMSLTIVEQDDLEEVLYDPFNEPKYYEPIAYFEDGDLFLPTKGNYTVSTGKITYIKKPEEVKYGSVYPTPTDDVQCDLPEHTHDEIVALAVFNTLEIIESQRLQTYIQRLKNIE